MQPKSTMHRIARIIVLIILQATLIAFMLLLAWAFESRKMAPLRIWHTVVLENEFTVRDAAPRSTLREYLALEERLFNELREKVYKRIEPASELIYSRYRAGGPQDPAWPQRNWNRTFEMVPDTIKGGVLLLHGLTDSPYSLRRIGEILYARGFYVLGLRLPGHGTVPGALTRVHWEDWVAASRIGARHVREFVGNERPFVIAGYSNGGGLAVKYALDAMKDNDLPVPDRLLLFSPEIGIDPLARVANLHKLLSFLPYFAQFKWLSIEPEYDPFKYNSFPKNGAREAWDVTAALQQQVQVAHDSGRFKNFPGVLTFLSWTDATVKTASTIQNLYGKMENLDSELIIFDVNRSDQIKTFIPAANEIPLKQLESDSGLPYRLTVITNVSGDSALLVRITREPRSDLADKTPLPMTWPPGVYSLAHVAIPFAPDDPVYGTGINPDASYQGLPLGSLQPRGETHLLITPLGQLMRLRHNPFFAYVEHRVIEEIEKTLHDDSRGNPH